MYWDTDEQESKEKLRNDETTEKIIEAFFRVYNTLGYGFLEKVCENAVIIEQKKLGLQAAAQLHIQVTYEESSIGEYSADIVAENLVIVKSRRQDRSTRNMKPSFSITSKPQISKSAFY